MNLEPRLLVRMHVIKFGYFDWIICHLLMRSNNQRPMFSVILVSNHDLRIHRCTELILGLMLRNVCIEICDTHTLHNINKMVYYYDSVQVRAHNTCLPILSESHYIIIDYYYYRTLYTTSLEYRRIQGSERQKVPLCKPIGLCYIN